VIVSFLTFELRPGSFAALDELFRRHRIFERAIQTEGCQSLYLAADERSDTRAHVIGLWDDEAAYQRWLDDPGREAGTDELHALVADAWNPSTPGEVWRVLHTAASTIRAGTVPAR
jgi:quinol monooxygenase YgiN